MKYLIIWAVVILVNGQPFINEYTQKIPEFDSEPLCLAYIEEYKERMKDIVRGVNNLPFEIEVHIQGNCQLKGNKDAQETELR